MNAVCSSWLAEIYARNYIRRELEIRITQAVTNIVEDVKFICITMALIVLAAGWLSDPPQLTNAQDGRLRTESLELTNVALAAAAMLGVGRRFR